MSRLGLEILAKSIYRELCDRGCQGSDVICLATALLDQILARKLEQSTENRTRQIVRLCPDINTPA